MLYTRKSFTCPATNTASQKRWDLAFLTLEEFKIKYNVTDLEYAALKHVIA